MPVGAKTREFVRLRALPSISCSLFVPIETRRFRSGDILWPYSSQGSHKLLLLFNPDCVVKSAKPALLNTHKTYRKRSLVENVRAREDSPSVNSCRRRNLDFHSMLFVCLFGARAVCCFLSPEIYFSSVTWKWIVGWRRIAHEGIRFKRALATA
jgi:hypothetical protein